MTKKPKRAAYDADVNYTVVLKDVVNIGPFKLLPRDTHEMKGSFIDKIIKQEGEHVIISTD